MYTVINFLSGTCVVSSTLDRVACTIVHSVPACKHNECIPGRDQQPHSAHPVTLPVCVASVCQPCCCCCCRCHRHRCSTRTCASRCPPAVLHRSSSSQARPPTSLKGQVARASSRRRAPAALRYEVGVPSVLCSTKQPTDQSAS